MLDALKQGRSEIGTHTQDHSSVKGGQDGHEGECSSAEHGTKQLQASGDGVGNGAGEVAKFLALKIKGLVLRLAGSEA